MDLLVPLEIWCDGQFHLKSRPNANRKAVSKQTNPVNNIQTENYVNEYNKCKRT